MGNPELPHNSLDRAAEKNRILDFLQNKDPDSPEVKEFLGMWLEEKYAEMPTGPEAIEGQLDLTLIQAAALLDAGHPEQTKPLLIEALQQASNMDEEKLPKSGDSSRRLRKRPEQNSTNGSTKLN
jgi:hypothetical protein